MNNRIVYILGLGHSGSTIVDIVLGNNPSLLSCGELTNVFEDAFTKDQLCSCGESGQNCIYWQRVKKKWLEKSSITIDEFIELTKTYESNNPASWIRLLANFLFFKTKNFKKYLENTILFLDVINDLNNNPAIIDSSKRILRCAILHLFSDYKILPIHLTRDLKGVLASDVKNINKESRKQLIFIKTIVRYLIINLQIKCFLAFFKQSFFLHYEELLSNPKRQLTAIGDLFQLDLAGSVMKTATQEILSFDHIVSGSYIRTQKDIVLQNQPNNKWRKTLSRPYIEIANFINKLWSS